MHLLQSNLDNDKIQFTKKLAARWNVEVNPKSISYDNSGVEIKENLKLEELESRIDEILVAAGRYYRENLDKQELIRQFAKYTWLAYSEQEIFNNDTGLTDNELKEFMRVYDVKFKRPVKDLLVEYYRVLHNPDLKFEGKLLEQLGFKACGACYEYNQVNTLDLTDNETKSTRTDNSTPNSSEYDDLPF